MITKPEAVSQVARMAQMIGYPKAEREALNELVLAAMAAKDLETARKVISEFLDRDSAEMLLNDRPKCPTSRDIRAAMYAADKPEYWQPEWGAPKGAEQRFKCETCADTGMAGGSGAADPWRWCTCEAARRAQEEQPAMIRAANETLSKILGNPNLKAIA